MYFIHINLQELFQKSYNETVIKKTTFMRKDWH